VRGDAADAEPVRLTDVVHLGGLDPGGHGPFVPELGRDPPGVARDPLHQRFLEGEERHLVGVEEGEHGVPVEHLLDHEGDRRAPPPLAPSADLDGAELRVLELLPLVEPGAQAQLVVEEELLHLVRDRAVLVPVALVELRLCSRVRS
jgi:hypothetical protein